MILLSLTKGNKIYFSSLLYDLICSYSNTWLIRFSGTIVGVEDISPHWANSKWRSLKVLSSWTCMLIISMMPNSGYRGAIVHRNSNKSLLFCDVF